VPGQPAESLLWQKLEKDEMPKTDNKVSEANKQVANLFDFPPLVLDLRSQ
jgi:hypothetical protein